MLRWSFDGASKGLRWICEGIQGFFALFLLSLLAADASCDPPSPHFAFLLVPLYLLPRGYIPAAQTSPPAAPEPAIQSASQPGTNFPDERIVVIYRNNIVDISTFLRFADVCIALN